MKTTKSILAVGLTALMMTAVGAAHATTLDTLFGGGSLTDGNQKFDQFSLVINQSSGSVVDATKVNVTPLGSGDPGLNFAFQGGLSATGDGIYAYSDFGFRFRVSLLDSGFVIEDASLKGLFASLTSQQALNCTPTGDPASPCNDLGVFIAEWVYADAALTQELGYMETQFSYLDGIQDGNGASDHITFAGQNQVWIKKNILVWSVNETDTANLTEFEQSYSEGEGNRVPEPASFLLVGAGLLAMARRRRT